MTPLELAYRTAGAGGGLTPLIALLDTLAGDLRRGAEAERGNDLTGRSHDLNHALQVLAFLEDRLSHGSGGDLARLLANLYRTVRSKIILAQTRRSPAILEEEMANILRVRELLQSVELRPAQEGAITLPPVARKRPDGYPIFEPKVTVGSWSA